MIHEIYCEHLRKAHTELEIVNSGLYLCEQNKGLTSNPVIGTGYALADVLVVKDSPTTDEAQEGYAFSSRAGTALISICIALGIEPSLIYATNATKCSNRSCSPEDSCIKRCSKILKQELRIVHPNLIIAFGTVAAEMLGISCEAGSIMDLDPETSVLVTLNIDEAIEDKGAKQNVWRHLKMIMPRGQNS